MIVSELSKMKVEILLPQETIDNNAIFPVLSHGSKVIEIISGAEDLSNCDGMFTKNKDFKLGVKTADCAPVCLSDGETVGIAHVGWRGLCAGMIENMLPFFNKEKLEIFVGPFIHSFPIKKDFCYEKTVPKFGNQFFKNEGDKKIFEFKKAIASLLPKNTIFDPRNTFEDLSLPSYRRDKSNERFATVVSF